MKSKEIMKNAKFRIKHWMLAILLGALCFSYLAHQRTKTPFHGDEPCWISSGLFYSDLLLNGDACWEHWVSPELASWGEMNTHVGKWIIGVPLRMHYPELKYMQMYDFGKSEAENAELGNIPPDDVLHDARLTSAVVGAFCCAVVFYICCLTMNRWVGGIAVVLLIANQTFIDHATRAMTDVSYNLFLVGTALASFFLLKATSKKGKICSSMAVGLLTGLACSVKVTGILVGGLFVASLLLYRGFIEKQWKAPLRSLILFGCTALAAVYLLNPYYWINVRELNFSALKEEIHHAPLAMEKYAKLKFAPAVWDVDAENPQLMNLLHPLLFPYQFQQWSWTMAAMKDIPSAAWGKHRLLTLHRTLFSTLGTFRRELIFFAIGLVAIVRKLRDSLRNHEWTAQAVPLLFFLCNYLFIVCFMKLNWSRYYLPSLMAGRIIVAYGIYLSALFLYRKALAFKP